MKYPEKGMAGGTGIIYHSELNKGFGSKFQRMSLEEDRSVKQQKNREYEIKDGNKSLDNVNNFLKNRFFFIFLINYIFS